MNRTANKQYDHLVFREVKNSDELLEMGHLRYRVLHNSNIASLCPENNHRIEFDVYDLTSRHFILVSITHKGEQIIGCQRGVFPKRAYRSKYADFIEGSDFQNLLGNRETEFPCVKLSQCDQTHSIRRFCDETILRGESIGESSRFIIDPEYASIRIAVFLARSIIATYMLSLGLSHGITIVGTHHKKFFTRCGFVQVEGTKDVFYPRLGQNETCLRISKNLLPIDSLTILDPMADVFSQTGEICFNPERLDCFYAPDSHHHKTVMAVA